MLTSGRLLQSVCGCRPEGQRLPSVAKCRRGCTEKKTEGQRLLRPPPHPFPPGDLRNRAPSRHLLAGGPAMARRCHLCSGPLPPVLGARALRSQHGPSSHRTRSVGCSPHHCCSIFSPLPAMLPTKVKRHRGVWGREQLSGVSPADARLNVAPKARGPSYPANRCPGVFSLPVTQDLSLQETVN